MAKNSNQRGFSLVEVLIALTLVTVLSVVALNALTPWLMFKQTLDTDRKLQDMRQTLLAAYGANAMAVDSNPAQLFLSLKNVTVLTGGQCPSQAVALSSPELSGFLGESGGSAANDGFANPLCFFITPVLTKSVEGVLLNYRMIAVVSTGNSGYLDPGTALDMTNGNLTLGGDDRGVVVNGYGVQYGKYRDTLDRVNRLASLYESYFTTRFLNTASRDVAIDYFYQDILGDAAGTIPKTQSWTRALDLFLGPLGVSEVDATSAYEAQSATNPATSAIEVANNGESVVVQGLTTTVRSPAAMATGATPPYTALLRAKLPGAADNYLVRAVVGNY